MVYNAVYEIDIYYRFENSVLSEENRQQSYARYISLECSIQSTKLIMILAYSIYFDDIMLSFHVLNWAFYVMFM